MNASTETVRLLMEIGLMAAGAGLIDEAGKIFEGVRAVRPDDASPLVGLAIAQIHSGRPHDAVDTLETALRVEAGSDYAKSYLGMAMLLAGRQADAKSVLQSVAAEGREAAAVALAGRLLEEV